MIFKHLKCLILLNVLRGLVAHQIFIGHIDFIRSNFIIINIQLYKFDILKVKISGINREKDQPGLNKIVITLSCKNAYFHRHQAVIQIFQT